MSKALSDLSANQSFKQSWFRQEKSPQQRSWGFWLILAVVSLVCLLPVLSLIFLSVSDVDGKLWTHLVRTVLPGAILNTFLLLGGVGVVTAVLGVSTAWLVTVCRFPGQTAFSVLLLLPLALPTYVSAFAYLEFLGFGGPLQSVIRDFFGFKSVKEYWFPDYRTFSGAILVMSLVLYPYVYLATRASFAMQSKSILDASRTLGTTPWKMFWKVGLPLARPAVVVGVALAMFETANDIGAVEFFGVKTLMTTVYDVWLNRSSLTTATQIACLFLIVVLYLLWLENHARRKQRQFESNSKAAPYEPFQLRGSKAALAFLVCFFPVLFGFLVPVLVLLDGGFAYISSEGFETLIKPIQNTLFLSISATITTVGIGFLFAYVGYGISSPIVATVRRLATLGYAIPGVILAIGLLIPITAFENSIDRLMRDWFNVKTGLFLSGTAFTLILAYSLRFLSISYGVMDSSFKRMSPNFGHAARSLGRSEAQTVWHIYLPLLRPALITGSIIVFVDCMKELPATLLLRPFNFDTLATRVYDSASLEVFEAGALPALAIVLVGLLPVILLSKQSER